MNMTTVVGVLAVLTPALAHAGIGTSEGVQCWNKEQDEISVSCSVQKTSDGGSAGSCMISTFLGGWKGTRTNWALDGRVRPIGGSHPIANKEKGLAYTYAPGEFGCAISPPLGYTYTVGDCTIDKKTAIKTCILNMQSEGSNKYYEATAVAKPY
jgi:hypothetical protein